MQFDIICYLPDYVYSFEIIFQVIFLLRHKPTWVWVLYPKNEWSVSYFANWYSGISFSTLAEGMLA